MNCRICNRVCKPLFQLDNMPDRNQHLSDKPDTKGITLNVVRCNGCGLLQLDNEPAWYWQESINSTALSPDLQNELGRLEGKVSFCELEHDPYPGGFIRLRNSLDWILVPNSTNMQPYDFCIDHLMYFDEKRLQYALEYNGLLVKEIKTIYNDVIIAAHVKRYDHIAIYGAGHQAFAWLAMHPNFRVDCFFDDNNDKQGKYSPATNLPICELNEIDEDVFDAVIVMAGGYSDEVIAKLKDFDGDLYVLKDGKVQSVEK